MGPSFLRELENLLNNGATTEENRVKTEKKKNRA